MMMTTHLSQIPLLPCLSSHQCHQTCWLANASQALFAVFSSLVGGRVYAVDSDQVYVAVAACWAQAPHQALDPSPLPVANRLLLFA